MLEEYQPQLADARNEAAGSSRRPARQADEVRQRPDRQGRGRGGRDPPARGRGRRARRRAGHGRPAGRGGRSCRSSWPRRWSSTTSTVTPRSQLIESYINQVGSRLAMAEHARDRRLRGRRCSRSPGPRARSPRSRTSCSASPARFEGNDELRMRSPTRRSRPSVASAVVEDLLGAKALADDRGARRRSSSAPAAPRELPAIIDRFVELRRRRTRARAVAEVRSRDRARPTTSSTRLPTALSQATGKEVEVKVIVDPTVLGGIVAERRRHGHRRLRPSPTRTTEGSSRC